MVSVQDLKALENSVYEIAKTYNKLLGCVFDMENEKKRKRSAKKGLFFRKKADPYEELLNELSIQKEESKRLKDKVGLKKNDMWWMIPWQKVEKALLYDLSFMEDKDGWRFKRDYYAEDGNGATVVALYEEGHFSSYSADVNFKYGIESQYSADEIKSRLERFDRDVSRYESETAMKYSDSHLVSADSGIVYNSADDYFMSGEHALNVSSQRSSLQRSLYTETETTEYTVVSNSINYITAFIIGAFSVNSLGDAVMIRPLHYKVFKSEGKMPREIEKYYRSKSSLVALAAYLGRNPKIRHIHPIAFGNNIISGPEDEYQALQYAEALACVAHKFS